MNFSIPATDWNNPTTIFVFGGLGRGHRNDSFKFSEIHES